MDYPPGADLDLDYHHYRRRRRRRHHCCRHYDYVMMITFIIGGVIGSKLPTSIIISRISAR